MSDIKLPDTVTHVKMENKDIYLIGTAHLSKKSVEDVQETVSAVKPDSICVELCSKRHKALTEKDSWKQLDIFKVIKEKKAVFLLAQLIMSSFYRQLGDKFGITPGAEMLEGCDQAKKTGAELVLADREIEITLKRVWRHLNFWNKLKMMSQVLAGFFVKEDIDENIIEEMKQKDQLENVMQTFAEGFPGIKERLIDERDIFLAQKIREAKGKKIVGVIGAGHIGGICSHIQKEHDLKPLQELPPKSKLGSIMKWGIPILILGILIFGFFQSGVEHSLESIYIWILVNGILAALGSAIALAHPLTILASFVGAPLTSLNPMIAAGWVAGLVQAFVRKPKVGDFEDLPNAITSVKGFWKNPVTKVLLVVVLANLGSSAGTFISGAWIAARTF